MRKCRTKNLLLSEGTVINLENCIINVYNPIHSKPLHRLIQGGRIRGPASSSINLLTTDNLK